ncbi:MAG: hypothetical protein WCI19_11995 [Betaproteobacteria bacterium]|jgi:hypothetical protein|nr:hypothetical protein [Rhodocyclales bacterium]
MGLPPMLVGSTLRRNDKALAEAMPEAIYLLSECFFLVQCNILIFKALSIDKDFCDLIIW